MKRLLKIINEKSTNRRFRKQATMIAGMSAMVVTKMELQRLKREIAEYQYPLHWNMERQPQIWSWDGYDGRQG